MSRMRFPRTQFPAAICICCVLLLPVFRPEADAQTAAAPQTEAEKLTNIYNAAMQAFNGGAYQEAATGLEKVIAMVTDPKEQGRLAPILYTLGAAYFNMANYPKAINVFQLYLKKFPNAERAAETRLALARSTFLNKDYEGGVKLFEQLESVPGQREQALLAQAACYKELKKPDDEIRVLEKLIAPEIRTSAQANGAEMLVQAYLGKQQNDKALDILNKMHARIAAVDNVVALNGMTVKLADELAEKKAYPQALAAYRVVRTRDQVIEFQNDRIEAMNLRIQKNLDDARANPALFLSAVGANNEIKAQQERAKKLLAEFEKMPDFTASLFFRMAKIYYDWGKKWEAIVVFDRLLTQCPDAKECEPALYSKIICYADLNRVASTLRFCDAYLEKFPAGQNAATVGYLKGASALQSGDPKSAATFFGTMLEKQPNSDFREQMRFLLGNAFFMQGEFAEARKNYERYLKDFPKGALVEEAQYRDALTYIFAGEYEQAQGKIAAYQQKYPQGTFAADAGYRAMVCKYSASLYNEVIADAAAWQKRFPHDAITGEILSLLGDALAATEKRDEAAAAYIQAYQRATTDEVMNYALFEASKQLQKQGRWAEVSKLFEGFVKEKPDNPSVVAAMFWISKAKAREGKTEEAKAFLVEQLKNYINDPKREAVEQLLQQLAQLCSKRPRPPVSAAPAATPAPAASVAANGSPTPLPPTPTPTPMPAYDAVGELKKQLAPLEEIANDTGKARLLYAQAELAKLRKADTEVQKIYGEIAERFKEEVLSPVLLAFVGDYLLGKGEIDRASKLYEALREDYPKSNYLDFAYVGLGEIALGRKDYKHALELFSRAADDIAGSKMKEATIGKARALLELGRYDESKKLFEQVASIREWRGESTALSMFYLGEIEARQGRWAEAIAHYQRVFVAYQKFLPWAAKSYLRGAESFDKLGKRTEAIGHLKEMLRNEKLKDFPETKQAKKMLNEWGEAV